MFQPSTSGIQQMYNQIVPVLTVIADEATLKAALAGGVGSLAGMIAAYQAAQNLKAALAALSQSGNAAEAAYAAQLAPKIDAVITTLGQSPVTVKDLVTGNATDQLKDSNGNVVTLAAFLQNPTGNYQWDSSLDKAKDQYYKGVGWVQIAANGDTTTPAGISVSESTDTHGNSTMHGSGSGTAIEGYASVQLTPAAIAALMILTNSF